MWIAQEKITGDHAVGAGEVTWESNGLKQRGTWVRTAGVMATSVGNLMAYGQDRLAFRWDTWKTVEFRRMHGPPRAVAMAVSLRRRCR